MVATIHTFKQRDQWLRALAADDLHPTIKLVGMRLALFLHCRTGRCNPAYATLADAVHLSRSTIERAMMVLKSRGWLLVEKAEGWHHTNQCMLLLPPDTSSADAANSSNRHVTPDVSNPPQTRHSYDLVDTSLLTYKKRKEKSVVRDTVANSSKKEQKRAAPKVKPTKTEIDQGFDQFWGVYPKRVARLKAHKAFNTAIKNGTAPEVMIEGARRYAHERTGQDQKYTKHPAAWIADGRYADERHEVKTIDESGEEVIQTENTDDPWASMAANVCKRMGL